MAESTLVIIKSDAVQRNIIGQVIDRFERRGLSITNMKMCIPDELEWMDHYLDHNNKPFFNALITRMIVGGKVVFLRVTGPFAISLVRNMTGATDASKAAPGTIRGDFGTSIEANVIHSSVDEVAAIKELKLWF